MKDCIIVFSANTENWGAERSVCSMCDALQKKGEKVVVIIPKEGKIINLLKTIDVDYIVSPFTTWTGEFFNLKRPNWTLKYLYRQYVDARSIIRIVSDRGIIPKLVYSSIIFIGVGIYCAKKWNVPHVHHFRENIDAFGYKFMFGYKRTMSYISKNTTHIICTCNAIKERYINEIATNKISVIYNGVPPVAYASPLIYDGNLKIIQVARYMNDKRITDSLHAVNILVQSNVKNIHLDIYGEGPEEHIYRDYIKSNKLEEYITLKGFVQNIPFQKYQVGLMTSTYEAFARTTLDYMNNSLAVIASNSGGNIEQVVDGVTGLLYEVLNPESLADKIRRLLDEKKILQYGLNGRHRFLDNFTQDKYQERISSVILSIINK